MDRNKVDLRFLISNFEDIAPAEITRLTGITPVYIRTKGEKRNHKNPESPVWETNLWSINSGLGEFAEFEEQMTALLDIIESKINVYKPLCLKYYSEFSCAVFTYRDNDESTPWVHLGSRYNKIAAELNCEFDLDLYAW
jgi:hypothetical protein